MRLLHRLANLTTKIGRGALNRKGPGESLGTIEKDAPWATAGRVLLGTSH